MNWLMVLIVTTGLAAPASVTTMEFADKTACELAGSELQRRLETVRIAPLAPRAPGEHSIAASAQPPVTLAPPAPTIPLHVWSCVKRDSAKP